MIAAPPNEQNLKVEIEEISNRIDQIIKTVEELYPAHMRTEAAEDHNSD